MKKMKEMWDRAINFSIYGYSPLIALIMLTAWVVVIVLPALAFVTRPVLSLQVLVLVALAGISVMFVKNAIR